MDARIEAGAMTLGVETPAVDIIVTVKADKPVIMLVSLFDAASILAPLLNQTNSVSAVSDQILERTVSGLALVS